MADINQATFKKIQTLVQIAAELRQGKDFSITRLTLLKSRAASKAQPRVGLITANDAPDGEGRCGGVRVGGGESATGGPMRTLVARADPMP